MGARFWANSSGTADDDFYHCKIMAVKYDFIHLTTLRLGVTEMKYAILASALLFPPIALAQTVPVPNCTNIFGNNRAFCLGEMMVASGFNASGGDLYKTILSCEKSMKIMSPGNVSEDWSACLMAATAMNLPWKPVTKRVGAPR